MPPTFIVFTNGLRARVDLERAAKAPIRAAAATTTSTGTISFALRMGSSLRVDPEPPTGQRGSCTGRYAPVPARGSKNQPGLTEEKQALDRRRLGEPRGGA